MRNHTPGGNEISTGSEPYTLRVEMRVVDPTLPRYGTDLMTLQTVAQSFACGLSNPLIELDH
jgi:hypothetical protein